MQKYIALLRGINVGGNNKISMPELKAAFEEHAFHDVITYINSGNIIFSTSMEDAQEIKKQCETIIQDKFKLNISVMIISAQDYIEAMQHIPVWWGKDSQSKHNAIFVVPPVSAQEVIQQIGQTKPEYEQVGYYKQVIFWSAPLSTFSKTRWSKITDKSFYQSITIRNANTAKKLLQLIESK